MVCLAKRKMICQTSSAWCLNPCFDGMSCEVDGFFEWLSWEKGLNPCFDGMSCEDSCKAANTKQVGVLILVLMECLAKDYKTDGGTSVTTS